MDKILLIYLLGINLLTFIMFGMDKWKAVHGKWRIREKTLLGLSLVGGASGGLLAMNLFRHKTQKTWFKIGMPVMLAAQVVLVLWLFFSADLYVPIHLGLYLRATLGRLLRNGLV